jgi:hypothetical protein
VSPSRRRRAASELAPELAEPPTVTVGDEGVAVTVAVRADYLFADVIPGAPDGTVVTATGHGRSGGALIARCASVEVA